MPTYHPAYLLRNAAPMEKRRLWEDMLQVMEKIGMTISERQRNFFLTKMMTIDRRSTAIEQHPPKQMSVR